jgi:uncharacterized protein (DUF4415 family)
METPATKVRPPAEKRRRRLDKPMKIAQDLSKQIEALLKLRDEEINLSKIPEVKDWSKADVGRFYRPVKQSVTIRLDSDVVAWLKEAGPRYQTRINAILRRVMKQRGS